MVVVVLVGFFLIYERVKLNALNVDMLKLTNNVVTLGVDELYGRLDRSFDSALTKRASGLAESYQAIENVSPSRRRLMGLALLVAGLSEEAAGVFDAAQKASPADESLALQRAEAHARAGHDERALAIWREFDAHEYFLQTANTLPGLTIEDREHYFSLALLIQPADPAVYRDWMRMANDEEDWVTITRLWSAAKDYGIRDNDVFFLAARALERLGQVDDAQALLLEAITLEGVKSDTMLALTRLYWENGDQEAGDRLVAQVKEQFPDEGHPYFFHANFLFRHGRYAESLPVFREALAHGYENALIWERIGIAHYRTNQYEAAREALQRASQLQLAEAARGRPVGAGREIQLLLYRGATLWELQQVAEASSYACEALRRSGFPQQLPPLPPELVGLCTNQP